MKFPRSTFKKPIQIVKGYELTPFCFWMAIFNIPEIQRSPVEVISKDLFCQEEIPTEEVTLNTVLYALCRGSHHVAAQRLLGFQWVAMCHMFCPVLLLLLLLLSSSSSSSSSSSLLLLWKETSTVETRSFSNQSRTHHRKDTMHQHEMLDVVSPNSCCVFLKSPDSEIQSRWWFQAFFKFSPLLGEMIQIG